MRQLVILSSFDRDWKRLSTNVQEKVRPHLFALQKIPFPFRGLDIAKLSGTKPALFRLRVGDYRVIFSFSVTTVTLFAIGHRKDIYRGF